MKKIFGISLGALLLAASLSANAWWGGNSWGNNGYWDDNDWPVFTPMYWMEEMFDVWDDDYDYYGGPGYGYGAPYGGYRYGSPYAAPYGAPVYQAQTAPETTAQ